MGLIAAQQSLTNFYVSVQFQNPAMALRMSDDIRTAALYALSHDKSPGYEAVRNLQSLAQGLPAVHAKILDLALEDLGYSFAEVYRELA